MRRSQKGYGVEPAFLRFQQIELKRWYFITEEVEAIERPVNYFLLMIEHLGGRTLASCGGHPRGFYILFKGRYELARRISDLGWFTVEVDHRRNHFTIRLCDFRAPKGQAWQTRDEILTNAAVAWEEEFGQMSPDFVVVENSHHPLR